MMKHVRAFWLLVLAVLAIVGVGVGTASASQPTSIGSPSGPRVDGDHGAIPASDVPSAPPCTGAQLASTYWTSLPGNMASDLSGVTVRNRGRTCVLPTEITSAAVVDKKGMIVRFNGFSVPTRLRVANAVFASPTDTHREPEFADMARAAIAVWLRRSTFPRLALSRGGEAVLVILTTSDPSVTPTNCLAPPAGGGFAITLSGTNRLMVAVPHMPSGGGPENPTGSAFAECSTGLVAPFVTWNEAARVVGGPPSLPSRDSPIFDRAP